MASEFEAYLAELFEPVGRVVFRRMFGGTGIFRDGLMLGLVASDTLYFKCDEDGRAAFEAEGCGPFSYETRAGGTRTLLPYWRAPERLFDDPDEFRTWALAAVDVAIRANARRTAKRPRSEGRKRSPA